MFNLIRLLGEINAKSQVTWEIRMRENRMNIYRNGVLAHSSYFKENSLDDFLWSVETLETYLENISSAKRSVA